MKRETSQCCPSVAEENSVVEENARTHWAASLLVGNHRRARFKTQHHLPINMADETFIEFNETVDESIQG